MGNADLRSAAARPPLPLSNLPHGAGKARRSQAAAGFFVSHRIFCTGRGAVDLV